MKGSINAHKKSSREERGGLCQRDGVLSQQDLETPFSSLNLSVSILPSVLASTAECLDLEKWLFGYSLSL